MTVVLAGPQRFRTTAPDLVRSAAPEGPVATVTAGWREREPADAQLDEALGGRTLNLGLYGRRADVLERDPELAEALRHHRQLLDERAAAYLIRLGHAVEAVYAIRRRAGDPRVAAEATADALDDVRALDARHLARLDQADTEFSTAWPLHDRPAVAEHRAAVAERLARVGAVVIAGGHVDVLLDCLHLFDVGAGLRWRGAEGHVGGDGPPVVAWSAGAMAVTERVVLFHDRAPHSPGHAEVFGRGLALCRGVVALPHARRRLRLSDGDRMAVLARRFAPARCVVLDDGDAVRCEDGGECCPPGTRVVTSEGTVAALEAA